eukprot:2275434-Amphidinium_carterae.1
MHADMVGPYPSPMLGENYLSKVPHIELQMQLQSFFSRVRNGMSVLPMMTTGPARTGGKVLDAMQVTGPQSEENTRAYHEERDPPDQAQIDRCQLDRCLH